MDTKTTQPMPGHMTKDKTWKNQSSIYSSTKMETTSLNLYTHFSLSIQMTSTWTKEKLKVKYLINVVK